MEQKYIVYLKALQNVLLTEDGKVVLEHLTNTYFDRNVIGETPEDTYYNLGQQEVISQLKKEKDMSISDYKKHLYGGNE